MKEVIEVSNFILIETNLTAAAGSTEPIFTQVFFIQTDLLRILEKLSYVKLHVSDIDIHDKIIDLCGDVDACLLHLGQVHLTAIHLLLQLSHLI